MFEFFSEYSIDFENIISERKFESVTVKLLVQLSEKFSSIL